MDQEIKINYSVIKTDAELENTANYLNTQKIIGVDLEADSLHHFKEKVCLLQISSDQQNFLIDPLSIQDMSPLKPVFANPAIKKVFHGADYDIRSLHRDFGIEIRNLFDTQLACMFLGIKSTGLDSVLQANFKISLDKRYQRKDWSVRPLPLCMMNYASLDSAYLLPLAAVIEKKLAEKKRLDWVYEECEYLSRVRFEKSNGVPLFLKFKGAGRLDPESLAVLEALLQFRKENAQKKDRPLFKIFSNRSIMGITYEKPAHLHQLAAKEFLSAKQIQIYGKTIINIITAVLKKPDADWPVYPKKKSSASSPVAPKKVKVLKEWRDRVAAKLSIDPGVLISNNIIHSLVIKKPATLDDLKKIECLKNWRRKEFGKDILLVLYGASCRNINLHSVMSD